MKTLTCATVLILFAALMGLTPVTLTLADAPSAEPVPALAEPSAPAEAGPGVESEAAVPGALKIAEAALRAAVEAAVGDFRLTTDGGDRGRATRLRLHAFQVEDNRFVVTLTGRPATLDQAGWAALTNAVDLAISRTLTAAGLAMPPAVEYDITLNGGYPILPDGSATLPPRVDELAAGTAVAPLAVTTIQGQKIVLSPGHGRYQANGWPYQRPLVFGIVEDAVNLDMVIALNNALASTGAQRLLVRQLNKSAGNHAASGRPWWEMGAREYIRAQGLPSSVWNQGSTNLNRDIMTRPNYAKYVGANALVSIHNNAGGGCGTETWYDTTNGYTAQSRQLAQVIQTKIIQRLRQNWNAGWCDRGIKGSAGGYGENRYFNGPAVIVEVGFMDTQSDSNALRNATFQAIVAGAIKDALVEYFGGSGGVDYTPPPGYTFCVYENQRCNFSGVQDVAYGANGVFVYRYNVSGGIDCNNAVFGDPLSGIVKACFIRPIPTVFSGNPSSALTVGQQQVRLDVCADNLPGHVVYATLYRGPVGSYGERLWRHQVTTPTSERCVTFVDMDGAGDTLAGVTYYTVASLNPISDGDATARRTSCFSATGGRQLCDARSR